MRGSGAPGPWADLGPRLPRDGSLVAAAEWLDAGQCVVAVTRCGHGRVPWSCCRHLSAYSACLEWTPLFTFMSDLTADVIQMFPWAPSERFSRRVMSHRLLADSLSFLSFVFSFSPRHFFFSLSSTFFFLAVLRGIYHGSVKGYRFRRWSVLHTVRWHCAHRHSSAPRVFFSSTKAGYLKLTRSGDESSGS